MEQALSRECILEWVYSCEKDERLVGVSGIFADIVTELSSLGLNSSNKACIISLSAVRLFPFYVCKHLSLGSVLRHLHVEKTAGTYFTSCLVGSGRYTPYSASVTELFSESPKCALPYMLNFLAEVLEGKTPLITGHYSLSEYLDHKACFNGTEEKILVTTREPREIALSMYFWMTGTSALRASRFFREYVIACYGCDPASLAYVDWLEAPATAERLSVYERAIGLNCDDRFTRSSGSIDVRLLNAMGSDMATLPSKSLDSYLAYLQLPQSACIPSELANRSQYPKEAIVNKEELLQMADSFYEINLPSELLLFKVLTRLPQAAPPRAY